ncbi:Uncharacterized GPI-anchored protein At4g28100 [Linum grandiflorum]
MAIPNLLLHFLLFPLIISALPEPDPETIQQLLPIHSPPSTIPAFPEQSNLQSCPLHLPPALFPGVKSACSSSSGASAALHRTRCCPVLAAWLYSAYSATALSRPNRVDPAAANRTKYDMPLLPDDSEDCVDSLEKGLTEKGIELPKPNETCDAVYCYCGIRLHRFTCPVAFSVDGGNLVGDRRVRRLEKDCLSSSDGFSSSGIGGCSKCLNTLNSLNNNHNKIAWNSSKPEERTTKMQNKDCQLMGLTWLLAKNRTAYIHTVSAVLRAIMLHDDRGLSEPRSCSVNSDGMPLAVDSSEIENGSWSIARRRADALLVVALLCLLSMVVVLVL